jgi:DNA repair protein RecO (recombination protein O)
VLLDTDAVVLHAFDYMESSRIFRLATRDAGVVSALARGARRPKSRFGGALDLFTGGVAHLSMRPGRDLQTLTGFDATRARHGLAADLGRFTAAAAIAELAIRFIGEVPNVGAYEALVGTLDAVAAAPPFGAGEVALAGAWHLVAELGFAPAVDECAACHASLADDEPAPFSHATGGVLCRRCAAMAPGGRPLPARARAAIRHWAAGEPFATDGAGDVAAHQRLLRLFLQAHLTDGRPLPAYDVWEQQRWGAA